MPKKTYLSLTLITMGMLVLSCVTPFYSTARIDKGLHMDAGFAAGAVFSELNDLSGYLVRGDIAVRYGFNDYFQAYGRLGLGPYVEEGHFTPFFDPALGIQIAIPSGPITPSFGMEVIFPPAIAPSFLLGLGRKEWLTLGSRLLVAPDFSMWGDGVVLFPEAFMVTHLKPGWSIFIGSGRFVSGGFDEDWHFTLGVGYKMPYKKR